MVAVFFITDTCEGAVTAALIENDAVCGNCSTISSVVISVSSSVSSSTVSSVTASLVLSCVTSSACSDSSVVSASNDSSSVVGICDSVETASEVATSASDCCVFWLSACTVSSFSSISTVSISAISSCSTSSTVSTCCSSVEISVAKTGILLSIISIPAKNIPNMRPKR